MYFCLCLQESYWPSYDPLVPIKLPMFTSVSEIKWQSGKNTDMESFGFWKSSWDGIDLTHVTNHNVHILFWVIPQSIFFKLLWNCSEQMYKMTESIRAYTNTYTAVQQYN